MKPPRTSIVALFGAFAVCCSWFVVRGSWSDQQPTTNNEQRAPAAPQRDVSVEDQVLANIVRQPIGRHSVADLHLPEAFLRREADRIIRSSFEERYRVVVRDPAARTEDGHVPAPGEAGTKREGAGAADGAVTLHEPAFTAAALEYRRSLPQRRPSNRAFIPAMRDDDPRWAFDEADAPPLDAAADLVARRLAVDGLLATTAHVIHALGCEAFVQVDEADIATLCAVGLPVDLLRHFSEPARPRAAEHPAAQPSTRAGSPEAIIESIASRLHEGASLQDVQAELRSATFAFAPTQPGFAVASESGETSAGVLRAQMTRGGYWKGEGDGGNADMLRQALIALPEARSAVSIEIKHAREFADTATSWPLTRSGQVTIVPEPLPVAQWAQDNGKPGIVGSASEGEETKRRRDEETQEKGASVSSSLRLSVSPTPDMQQTALLMPRYAGWGDDGSAFVPGETFLLPGAAEASGARLIHSPLLFQGGNLLCITHPNTGERILLVGDADVYRNTAMGLTLEQTLQAFKVEFGVDRCEMLPVVSFHLDYDVSVRAVGDRLVALVNDPLAAAVIIAQTGTGVLQRIGLIEEAVAKQAIAALQRGEHAAFLDRVAPIVNALGNDGRFALSLAEEFSTSSVDSGVGNLHRFLLAMDILISRALPAEQLNDPGNDRHMRSYLQSLLRGDADREALHQRLRELGMEVVPVPSISNATRSITAINGIHVREGFLMPAYGGLLQPVDTAALQAVQAALGKSVRVIPIICGESQRRCGAVHCSIAVFPTK